MEEEFQFLLCERCRREATNPKLLCCLHTVCTTCLEENKPIGQCPVCSSSLQGTDQAPLQDNLLFANLQARLNTYQKIVQDQEQLCNFCKGAAEFWCSKCDEFLCPKCYESHQWYLKQKSHETQRLGDLKKETARSFLEGAQKSCTLFCSEPTHKNQIISVYCRGCRKPLCCCCALLDGEHYNAKLYSDIHEEIQSRKEELGKIKEELVEKKRSCEDTHNTIHEQLQKLEKVRSETREMIQKKVYDMVQWIQQRGDEFLEKVDRQVCQEQEDAKKKLESTKQIIKRMEAGERLVEKMDLFGSDQEVMDMHPFIRESLERLKKEDLPVSSFQMQVENFNEVKGELQALLKRVKGEDAFGRTVSTPGSYNSLVNSEGLHNEKTQPESQGMDVQMPTYIISVAKTLQGFSTSMTSPAKRPLAQVEKSIQASPKMMKLEGCEPDAAKISHRQGQEDGPRAQQPLFHTSTPEQRAAATLLETLGSSPVEICESDNFPADGGTQISPIIPSECPGDIHSALQKDASDQLSTGSKKKLSSESRPVTHYFSSSDSDSNSNKEIRSLKKKLSVLLANVELCKQQLADKKKRKHKPPRTSDSKLTNQRSLSAQLSDPASKDLGEEERPLSADKTVACASPAFLHSNENLSSYMQNRTVFQNEIALAHFNLEKMEFNLALSDHKMGISAIPFHPSSKFPEHLKSSVPMPASSTYPKIPAGGGEASPYKAKQKDYHVALQEKEKLLRIPIGMPAPPPEIEVPEQKGEVMQQRGKAKAMPLSPVPPLVQASQPSPQRHLQADQDMTGVIPPILSPAGLQPQMQAGTAFRRIAAPPAGLQYQQQPAVQFDQQNVPSAPVVYSGIKLKPDGSNYSAWSKDVYVTLLGADLWNIIQRPPNMPWDQRTHDKNRRACAIILMSVNTMLLSSVPVGVNAQGLWITLQNLFKSRSVSSRNSLSRQLYAMKLKPGEDPGVHIAQMRTLRAQLADRGLFTDEDTMVNLILNSLDPSWYSFILSLETLQPAQLTIDYVNSRILEEHRRRQDMRAYSHTAQPKRAGRTSGHYVSKCSSCGQAGHQQHECFKQQSSHSSRASSPMSQPKGKGKDSKGKDKCSKVKKQHQATHVADSAL